MRVLTADYNAVQQKALLVTFSSLGQKLNTATTAKAASTIIIDAADELLGWDACNVSLYSPETHSVLSVLQVDTIQTKRVDATSGLQITRPGKIARRVLKEGPLLILRAHPAFEPDTIPFGDTSRPSASIMAVPLRHGASVIGFLSIYSYEINAYDHDSLATLQALADYCAGAMDRIRIQTQLIQREHQLLEAQRVAHVGSWHWDIERNAATWSDELYCIFGLKPQQFRASYETFLDHVHPVDRSFVKAANTQALSDGKPFHFQCRIVRPDGTTRLIYTEGEVVCDHDGHPMEMIGVMQDITERRKAEEQLQRSKEQLRALAAKLQAAREQESLRISREIHDVLGQALTSLNMDLVWLHETVEADAVESLRKRLRPRLKAMASLLETTVKTIQKICSDLRPGPLDDLGLAATLQWQAAEFERRSRIVCRWKHKPESVDLKRKDATALFRIFQEILTNVARHSVARHVRLEFRRLPECLVLQVVDDGKGFDEQKLHDRKSLGLLSMRERAALIGADIDIRSAPGAGTTVTVKLPATHFLKEKGRKNAVKKRRNANSYRR